MMSRNSSFNALAPLGGFEASETFLPVPSIAPVLYDRACGCVLLFLCIVLPLSFPLVSNTFFLKILGKGASR